MSDTAFGDAIAHHEAGRFCQAAALCRALLDHNPNHADSLHLLGLITAEGDDPRAGIALIQRAMALQPGFAPHHNSLGHVYRRLGRTEDALAAYRRAAALRPGSAEIHNNLGTVLFELGRLEEAVSHYRLATAYAPETAGIWCNLANALAVTDRHQETDACYSQAARLDTNLAGAFANHGRWLMTQGRWAEAEHRLREAVRIDPTQQAAWNNLGIVLQEHDHTGSAACYRNALVLDPNSADAHYNLGCLLFGDGRTEDALACHEAAAAADPGFGPARLAGCMAQLPILYGSAEEIPIRRRRYAAALETLAATIDSRTIASAIGSSQPFFLPYQGQDDRTLQSIYGHLACRVLAETEPPVALAHRPARGQRIRLGIVSGFFADHTVRKLFLEGWLAHLDRERFEITGFHTGRSTDAVTAACVELCDRFVSDLPSATAWRQTIAAAAPHVLLYPEVGIDPLAGRLAAQRLAPVQCVAWGQPETTGMPTIDAFLSSDLMEPPEGETYYTETLVRLPNLGVCYTPDEKPQRRLTRSDLGLDNSATVFWSGQALYKYAPDYDEIFPRIAAELGNCQFVFIGFGKSLSVTDAFRMRLASAFAARGLDAGRHVVILPPMPQRDFIDAVGLADVILDTPGWSGGKSTLDCLAQDPAIVTMPGRFMRGRHTAAILLRIGCEETIADSAESYVAIAVRLARDAAWRTTIRHGVAAGKQRAFHDTTCIRALEMFLTQAVSRL